MKTLLTRWGTIALLLTGFAGCDTSVRRYERIYREYNAVAHGGCADEREVEEKMTWFRTLDADQREKELAWVADDCEKLKGELADWMSGTRGGQKKGKRSGSRFSEKNGKGW